MTDHHTEETAPTGKSPKRTAHGRDEQADLQYGSTIQIRIARHDGEPVTLLLKGELDVTSMGPFERALADVRAEGEHGLTFDLRECAFVSIQGYEAMARCSQETHVEVLAGTDLASKVLALYGYEGIVRVLVPDGPLVSPH
jgi:hypothetical protein